MGSLRDGSSVCRDEKSELHLRCAVESVDGPRVRQARHTDLESMVRGVNGSDVGLWTYRGKFCVKML